MSHRTEDVLRTACQLLEKAAVILALDESEPSAKVWREITDWLTANHPDRELSPAVGARVITGSGSMSPEEEWPVGRFIPYRLVAREDVEDGFVDPTDLHVGVL